YCHGRGNESLKRGRLPGDAIGSANDVSQLDAESCAVCSRNDVRNIVAAMKPKWKIRQLKSVSEREIEALTDILIDCVEGGASVSFMQPLTRKRAMNFWRKVAEDVRESKRALLIAEN